MPEYIAHMYTYRFICTRTYLSAQAYKVEECADSLAFASEPVLASLANILAYQEQQANNVGQASTNVTKQASSATSHRTYTKEYELLDIEIKYGLLQVRDLLN